MSFDPAGDDEFEPDELEPVVPELTVYPTDEDPVPVLYLPDGTSPVPLAAAVRVLWR